MPKRIVVRTDQANNIDITESNLTAVDLKNESPSLKVFIASEDAIAVNSVRQSDKVCGDDFSRECLPGKTRFALLTMPPLTTLIDDYKKSHPNTELDLKTFRMHRTNTIDYVTVVAGEVMLQLPKAKTVHLKVGDMLVNYATLHSWHNHQNENCLLSIVQIGLED